MPSKRSRPGDGARGAAEVSTFGRVSSEVTANRTETESAPRALIVEAGAVRAATLAELRRLASRGLRGPAVVALADRWGRA